MQLRRRPRPGALHAQAQHDHAQRTACDRPSPAPPACLEQPGLPPGLLARPLPLIALDALALCGTFSPGRIASRQGLSAPPSSTPDRASEGTLAVCQQQHTRKQGEVLGEVASGYFCSCGHATTRKDARLELACRSNLHAVMALQIVSTTTGASKHRQPPNGWLETQRDSFGPQDQV